MPCCKLNSKKEYGKSESKTQYFRPHWIGGVPINDNEVSTRWKFIYFKACETTNLENAQWYEERVVNIPSGHRGKLNE